MRAPRTLLAGLLVLAVAGCTPSGDDAAPRPSATAVESAVTVAPGPEASTEAPADVTYGPDSTVLLGRRADGARETLEVRAPSHSRFRLGRSAADSHACVVTGTVVESGATVRYTLSCAEPVAGDSLITTTSSDGYAYTFSRPLA